MAFYKEGEIRNLGGLSHFSEHVYRRGLCQIVILVGNGILAGVDFFPGGTWKLSVQKIVNMNLKQKNDSKCIFYNFSILVPYPKNFLVCICILIFHGIYNPTPHPNIFFVEDQKNFLCVVASSLENFKLLGALLFWRDLISFLAEGGYTIFFHKAINDQSCKLKNS